MTVIFLCLTFALLMCIHYLKYHKFPAEFRNVQPAMYLSEFKAYHWICLLYMKGYILTCCILNVVLQQQNKSLCGKIFLIVVIIRVVQQLNRSFKAMRCILVDLLVWFFIISIFSKVHKSASFLNAQLSPQKIESSRNRITELFVLLNYLFLLSPKSHGKIFCV